MTTDANSRECIKHLVTCKCVLLQYKHIFPPIYHKFIVFSEIDSLGNILPSFAQCNNCGVIHKITEIGTSSVLKKEDGSSMVPSIDEIKTCLPGNLVNLLSSYQLELHTWQEIKFAFENKKWGKGIVLSKTIEEDSTMIGKYLLVLGENLWKIDTFMKTQDEL